MTREEAKREIDSLDYYLQNHTDDYGEESHTAMMMAIQALEQTQWIPVNKKLPKTDNKNDINSFNVLLWVKNKTHPEREAQIYLGKLRHVDGDDGSRNFWGIKTEPCEWTIWGWSYFNEPEVIAWMPLPESYKGE
jgi:hypothetical protein